MGKIIRILAVVGLTMSFVLVAQAEEVRQPMPAPAPTPGCIETTFSKIVLVHEEGAHGSYYAFVVHWYIDGKPYYVMSPSSKLAGEARLELDSVTRLWKLTWSEGQYTICVTAPILEEIPAAPAGYWSGEQLYTYWFMSTYPYNKVPRVATSPTPTPLVGI